MNREPQEAHPEPPHIVTVIARPLAPSPQDCGRCQVSCQSACKTSCTVGNQLCEQE